MPSRPLETAGQDWTPVVLNTNGVKTRVINKEAQKNISNWSCLERPVKNLEFKSYIVHKKLK